MKINTHHTINVMYNHSKMIFDKFWILMLRKMSHFFHQIKHLIKSIIVLIIDMNKTNLYYSLENQIDPTKTQILFFYLFKYSRYHQTNKKPDG
jgi:hypothetical protein